MDIKKYMEKTLHYTDQIFASIPFFLNVKIRFLIFFFYSNFEESSKKINNLSFLYIHYIFKLLKFLKIKNLVSLFVTVVIQIFESCCISVGNWEELLFKEKIVSWQVTTVKRISGKRTFRVYPFTSMVNWKHVETNARTFFG